MQQKLSEKYTLLCKDVCAPCGVALLRLPFRCPRCGERQRLHSLSSLRAHPEYGHTYHTVHHLGHVSGWEPVDVNCTEKCRSAAADSAAGEGSGTVTGPAAPQGPAGEQSGEPRDTGGGDEPGSCAGARVVRLEEMLRAADCSMATRLQRVSADLAQVDVELLRAHARSRHLAREKWEVSERERALCRQVDTAVVEIGRLRAQLMQSEQELEKKDLEVVSIQNFLEAAAQHELCGKVRLQHFIENLLRRIALAERLLGYYQNVSRQPNCQSDAVSQESGSFRRPPADQSTPFPEKEVIPPTLRREADPQAEP